MNKNNTKQFRTCIDYRGFSIELVLEDRVCLIRMDDQSNLDRIAIGAIKEYFQNSGVDCRYADGTMVDVDITKMNKYGKVDATSRIKELCFGGKVIILNNGDLYINGKEIEEIVSEDNCIIVAMQHPALMNCDIPRREYKIVRNEETGNIHVGRWM